jgi:uncharacterized repeat protein (TIGR03803 family)
MPTIYSFTGAGGATPEGGVVFDSAGDLFGTTTYGGSQGLGTIYEIPAGTTTATTLYSFTGADGANPTTGLTIDANGDIFGTTNGGGSSNLGTVFKIAANTNALTTLYSFSSISGGLPKSGLSLDDEGNLIGTTSAYGLYGYGAVYEIQAGTTDTTVIVSFDYTNGATPAGTVTLDPAGDIFGTTSQGGSHSDGTVYVIEAGSNTVTTLFSFDGNDGSSPQAGMTFDAYGNLFGTTSTGGSQGLGTVFEIQSGSTTVTTLFSFSTSAAGDGGAHPFSALTVDASGDLFGTTAAGGLYGDGTVYEIKAGANTATTLYSFSGTNGDGAHPLAGVTLDAAGDIFGTTTAGGVAGDGTVFEIAAVCYYAGTLILTSDGPWPVEELAIGTLVTTADGRNMPVRWIGRNTVLMRFADPLRVMPVRIRAGALDDGIPNRDLLVSPDHAVLVEGILVQAAALVNGISIMREHDVPESFVYYHVELAEHALILAEGTPAESFVDNIHRMAFDNWSEHEALYGGRDVTEMLYPRAQSFRQVPARVSTRLLARAERVFAASLAAAA